MEMNCSTCAQAIGGAGRDAAMNWDVHLFGAAPYVVCPTCNQIVPERLRTPAYKAAWTKRMQTKKAQAKGTLPQESPGYLQQETASARAVAEWMHEELSKKAILWYAYAASTIEYLFSGKFTRKGVDGEAEIVPEVLVEFRVLCGQAVAWDEKSAHWRLTGATDGTPTDG